MAIWLGLIFTAAGVFVGSSGFYFLHVRPERIRRRRFFDEALGHDGKDGLPQRDSIFERLDVMQGKLAAPLLNGKGEDLIRTVQRLDQRSARQGRELATIRRVLNIPAQRSSVE